MKNLRYMNKRLYSLMFLVFLAFSSSACRNETSEKDKEQTGDKDTVQTGDTVNQTGFTVSVPAEYQKAATHKGNVVRVDYESNDYVRNSSAITKTAYVYLPYGYDENNHDTRYDILYLMHGLGGHAGEYFEYGTNKNMFDRMIEDGVIKPTIIVSATFYNQNSLRDFGNSITEFRSFHLDFENHLMPTIEGKFHTYAESTSKKDLMASRDHRAFGGFSLGSVTTWLEFCYDADYISSFLPMSGSCWYFGGYGDYYPKETCDFFEKLIAEKSLNERGYFIYVATGTQDVVRDQVYIQMDEMLKRNDVFTHDHVVFYQKDGGRHDFVAVQEYIFNAFPILFNKSKRIQ